MGGGGGYFLVSNNYEPKIQDYENQVTYLNSEVNNLTTIITTLEVKNAENEIQISNLESDLHDAGNMITEYELQISEYELEVSSLEKQISNLESQIASKNTNIEYLQDEIDDLEDQMDAISDIVVNQYYEWMYQRKEWTWTLQIPLSIYLEYYMRPRPSEWEDYVYMVKDTYDDYYINMMVEQIDEAVLEANLVENERVNFVIAFIQSLPYTVDDVTTEWDEYPRYPIETLFDRGGDCEDTSILTAALFDKMGYDVCLLFLSYEKHVAVGIAIQETYGSYYKYNDKKYFYLETTGEGWRIGDMPSSFTDTRAYIYPINP